MVLCPLFGLWIICNCFFFNINPRVSNIIIVIMIPTIMAEQQSTIAAASPLLKAKINDNQRPYVHEAIKLTCYAVSYRCTFAIYVHGCTVVFVNSGCCRYRL